MTQTEKQSSPQERLEQRRAANAWKVVENVSRNEDKFKKEFGSLVRSLPALILSDGLGMSCAFLCAKDKDKRDTHYFEAYKNLSAWLVSELRLHVDDDALLAWIVNTSSSNEYRRATAEALAYLSWLKRFTEAKGWKSEESGD